MRIIALVQQVKLVRLPLHAAPMRRTHMALAEEPEEEETHLDRRKKYNELVAGGMRDKEATEKVWPRTTAGMVQNAKEKADKLKKEAPASKD